jgi:hypothetical protein
MEKEYAHINRGRAHNFDTLLKKEGTGSQVEFSDGELRIIDREAPLTLTVIHNHPNSTAPGHDDFFMLITRRPLRNMVVFGVAGSLYFVQKPNTELYLNYSGIEGRDKLKKSLKEVWDINAEKYAKKKYPNLKPKEREEIIRRSAPVEQNKILTAVLNEYYISMCDKLKLNCYPKEGK